MKELEFVDLQEITLQEIISFTKLENTPVVTILDNLNYGLFNQLSVWADALKIIFFIIKDTKKVAIIGNANIALKIAKLLQVKAQQMHYATELQPKKILGKIYVPKNKSNYIVRAYDDKGKPIKPFIDTNVEQTNCDNLLKYKFTNYKYAMRVRGSGSNKIESYESLRISRNNFLRTGKI